MNDDIDIIYILHSAFGTSLGDLTSESLFFYLQDRKSIQPGEKQPFFCRVSQKKISLLFWWQDVERGQKFLALQDQEEKLTIVDLK